MNSEIGGEFWSRRSGAFRILVQEAVDATVQAHREQPLGDVLDRLRSELSDRGVEINDAAWLSEAAGMIRAGLPVSLES